MSVLSYWKSFEQQQLSHLKFVVLLWMNGAPEIIRSWGYPMYFIRGWNKICVFDFFVLLPFLLPCGLPGAPTAGLGELAVGDCFRDPRSSSSIMRSDQVFGSGSLRTFPPLRLLEVVPVPLTQGLFWRWRPFWALSSLDRTAWTAALFSVARAVSFSASPALGFSVLDWPTWASLCWGLTLPTRLASLSPPVSVTLLGNRKRAKE